MDLRQISIAIALFKECLKTHETSDAKDVYTLVVL